MPEFVVEFHSRINAADERLDAAAYHRNFAPMLAVFQRVLRDSGVTWHVPNVKNLIDRAYNQRLL